MNFVSGDTNLPIASYLIVNGGTIQANGVNDTVGIGWSSGQAGVMTIDSGLVNFAGATVNIGHAVSGTLNLNGGTYIMSTEPANGGHNGVINLNGGTLQLNASVATFVPSGVTLGVGNDGAIFNVQGFGTNINSPLAGTGSGGLSVFGTSAGTLGLSANNTYTGPTTINGGLVAITGAGNLGTGNTLTLNGGRIDLGGTTPAVTAVNITAAAANGNTIQNGTLNGTSYTASNPSGNAVVAANLSGTSGLTMSGTGGQLTLTVPSQFGERDERHRRHADLEFRRRQQRRFAEHIGRHRRSGGHARCARRGVDRIGPHSCRRGEPQSQRRQPTTLFTVNGSLNTNQGTNLAFEVTNGLADQLNVNGAVSRPARAP